jgi:hypothetical protein
VSCERAGELEGLTKSQNRLATEQDNNNIQTSYLSGGVRLYGPLASHVRPTFVPTWHFFFFKKKKKKKPIRPAFKTRLARMPLHFSHSFLQNFQNLPPNKSFRPPPTVNAARRIVAHRRVRHHRSLPFPPSLSLSLSLAFLWEIGFDFYACWMCVYLEFVVK